MKGQVLGCALSMALGLALAASAAAAKNDCAEGVHSCVGQATKARDTKSCVLLPKGDCGKIQGGKTKPA